MKILVSACLLGVACRFDGKSKRCEKVCSLSGEHTLIPFCPEVYGGLKTPREPSEIVGEHVVNSLGIDVTNEYLKGAEETLRIFNMLGCDAAILKKKSPSCGKGMIYDGSFTRTLINGNGITAELLIKNGVPVFTEDEFNVLFAQN